MCKKRIEQTLKIRIVPQKITVLTKDELEAARILSEEADAAVIKLVRILARSAARNSLNQEVIGCGSRRKNDKDAK